MGDITSIQSGLINTLVESGYIPVVASVAADASGQALNVNADIAAGEVGTPLLWLEARPLLAYRLMAVRARLRVRKSLHANVCLDPNLLCLVSCLLQQLIETTTCCHLCTRESSSTHR